MADSEFITRADVERVRAEVQGIAGDYDAVESPDLVTHLYAGMYRVADSVLDHLLHPDSGMWFGPTDIQKVWRDSH